MKKALIIMLIGMGSLNAHESTAPDEIPAWIETTGNICSGIIDVIEDASLVAGFALSGGYLGAAIYSGGATAETPWVLAAIGVFTLTVKSAIRKEKLNKKIRKL